MIVNNHHLKPFLGEDYQTFERDLPGENKKGGYSADAVIAKDLPLESSDIIGKSWGYVTGDTVNRSVKELVHQLVGSAGLGANLLLNVGPTPEGEIRQAHRERLLGIGRWLNTYGETIYGTRKSFMKPAEWGVAVEKDNKIYLHIIHPEKLDKQLILDHFTYRLNNAYCFESGKNIQFKADQSISTLSLQLPELNSESIDNVIVLQVTKK
jgi:alpha-L-fucosidase